MPLVVRRHNTAPQPAPAGGSVPVVAAAAVCAPPVPPPTAKPAAVKPEVKQPPPAAPAAPAGHHHAHKQPAAPPAQPKPAHAPAAVKQEGHKPPHKQPVAAAADSDFSNDEVPLAARKQAAGEWCGRSWRRPPPAPSQPPAHSAVTPTTPGSCVTVQPDAALWHALPATDCCFFLSLRVVQAPLPMATPSQLQRQRWVACMLSACVCVCVVS
jgi:hypothetical protein